MTPRSKCKTHLLTAVNEFLVVQEDGALHLHSFCLSVLKFTLARRTLHVESQNSRCESFANASLLNIRPRQILEMGVIYRRF